MTPTLLELMDGLIIQALDALRGTGFGAGVGAVLLLQVDARAGALAQVEAVMAAGSPSDLAATTDATESRELLDIRRAVFPALQRLGALLVEDVCVPVSQLAEMTCAVVEIGLEHGVQACTVAHAADGNLHPVIVNDGDDRAVEGAAEAIFQRAQNLGGTVSGEHGIGRLKRDWLARELGEVAVDVQHRIKSALDPLGILNPGAIHRPVMRADQTAG
jgi:glycolate oxidase